MPSFGHLKLKDALILGETCAFRTSASDVFTFILYPDSCPYCSISTNNIGIELSGSETAAISLRLQGKLSFPYNCQKMNGQIYVLLC